MVPDLELRRRRRGADQDSRDLDGGYKIMPWVPGTGGFKHDQRYRRKHRCVVNPGHQCRGVHHKWCASSDRWPNLGFDKKTDAAAQCREWNKEAAEHDKRFGLKGDED